MAYVDVLLNGGTHKNTHQPSVTEEREMTGRIPISRRGSIMLKIEGEYDCFSALLQYEVRCSIRYRRFLSLILCTVDNREAEKNEEWIERSFRACDCFFNDITHYVILMPETNAEGAESILRRLRQVGTFAETEFVVVSFPEDGQTAEQLLERAKERMDLAINHHISRILNSL